MCILIEIQVSLVLHHGNNIKKMKLAHEQYHKACILLPCFHINTQNTTFPGHVQWLVEM